MTALAGGIALIALIPIAVTSLVLAIRESGRGHASQKESSS